MISLVAILGVVTGYYTGSNMYVQYRTGNSYISEDLTTYHFQFDLWYVNPSNNYTEFTLVFPELFISLGTYMNNNKPYEVDLNFEFSTLSLTNDNNDFYVDFSCTLTCYYTVSYYNAPDYSSSSIFNLAINDIQDYGGHRQVIDRDYTNRSVSYDYYDDELLQEYAYLDGFDNGYDTGTATGNGVNNVITWFGNVWNALTNILSLEIAPNLKIGTLITIPIVVGVLLFALKALIQ